MDYPIIGITMSRTISPYGNPIQYVMETYIDSILRARGCPILIPLGAPQEVFLNILKHVDGLLFTGGGDVHPEKYGSQPHDLVDGVDEDRDQIEIHLINEAVEGKIPFLGICRGLQVINVALGGTLYEDILDQRPDSIEHNYTTQGSRSFLAHEVAIVNDSLLSSLLTDEVVKVNSLHHQGIKNLASGLKASAFAPDGLIEAIELAGFPFGLAVQWHPECLVEDASMEPIFQALVQSASRTHGD